ncbi:aromatic ring-hydroxylating dioxygenase subunit alpha [Acinetobacter gerneri]|jgi:vanillate O-demethylase monooxygenase subunit|uniref:aromatic ring-hydroxylating dioxygenase subunit alpha n=1 Tax=Acinetobacter gerneri TaxID=202952 RepID=UPI0023F14CE5|nr:aromatic ring-hydroxylating dioxygenase subunit alpha [Acinetobacter gerneri]MCH4245833.1 aromatic ring-hydroxylating dioxygenase subunit alpha [Acinetobacter gerneri]
MNTMIFKTQTQPEHTFLKNTWYVAALSTDVDAYNLFTRKIMNINIVIYRNQDGAPVALRDRCPHRFAPLSLGQRDGDELVCPYHALKFDCTGKCTHNPHGKGHIPTAAKVQTFPMVERYGFLWIWMGDAEQADAGLLPDYNELISGHKNSVGHTYMHVKCNFELLTDNVMDLSHIDHVHGEIISTRGKLSPIVPKVTESQNSISARWEWEQQPAMMIFAPLLPTPTDPAQQYFNITWTAPSHIQLTVAAVQNGEFGVDDLNQYDLHTTTPETDTTTHYFFATRRNHIEEDASFNVMKIQNMHRAFEDEDVPLLEAVQNEMVITDFFSLNPVLMSNDIAPVRVRKKLLQLIEQESQYSNI